MVMIPAKKTEAAGAPAAPKAPPKVAAKPAAQTPAANPAADNTPGPAAETAAPPAPAAAETAAPAQTTAVAARPANAVVVAGRPKDVVTETFKNAFTVDWNTLNRIQATNGNFVDQEENKRVIGTEIQFEMMSFQDNWQISPGTDDDDDIQYVRYSDDGKTTTNGEDCNEYVAAMVEAGYKDCKMSQRVILAGTIVGGSHDGKLVQLNLAPTSKAMFDRFKMQVSIDIAKGKRTEADIRVMKLKAVPETKGKNTWTKVTFDYGA